VEQLESNLAALAVEVDSESLQRFEALREDPTAYWRTRAALPWN